MKKERPIRCYHTFTDDFVESKDQDCKVPEGYEWIKTSFFEKVLSAIIYAVAVVFALFYCRLFLHLRIKNRKVVKQAIKEGAFVYANHTQPLGDVFTPALVLFPNRIYTIVSPANLSIPFIGKILPYLGALPIPSNLHEMRKFNEAVEKRVKDGHCVIVYPEAHVWEYYTGIRPFPTTSFGYPIKYGKAAYSLTVTYQKRGNGKGRPKMVIYADGPFLPGDSVPQREKASTLRDQIFQRMTERSKNSNAEYIRYEKAE